MMKFNFADYTVSNVNSVFKLKSSPDSNTTFMAKLNLKNDQLVLEDMGGFPFNLDDAPYILDISDFVTTQNCDSCLHKNSPAKHSVNSRMLCDRHYNNEITLIKMSIREFLYKVNTLEEYKILLENYDPYEYNKEDLVFPCLVLMHKEIDNQYDMEVNTLYIINRNMGVVK